MTSRLVLPETGVYEELHVVSGRLVLVGWVEESRRIVVAVVERRGRAGLRVAHAWTLATDFGRARGRVAAGLSRCAPP